jgi:hypothetical protein
MLILSAYLLSLSHAALGHQKPMVTKTIPPEQIVWAGYGGNAQHTAQSAYTPSGYGAVNWSATIDANPPMSGSDIGAHYGEASLTANTIVIPTRTSNGKYDFQARSISTGAALWTYESDYRIEPYGYGWVPTVSGTLLPDGSFVGPRLGGGVFVRPHADQAIETTATYYPAGYPYGTSYYTQHYAQLAANVFIVTPMTPDSQGNVYFGIRVFSNAIGNLTSCFVKMSEAGVFTFYPCISGHYPTNNAAPALSIDGTTVYGVENVSGSWESHIIALNTTTMAKTADTILIDPMSGLNALAEPDATSSPLVAPDGDVYFGAYSNPWNEGNDRGWLLHYDKNLTQPVTAQKPFYPGAFGWDDTPSIVPSSLIPSYTGTSSYLLFCKYNDYADFGTQPGDNRVAIVDPNDSAIDRITQVSVMKPVVSALGVTPDPTYDQQFPQAVREWCINSAAVDIPGKSIVLNSEDGSIYKFDLVTGELTSRLKLTDGIGEPYTPTIIAKDGTIFAVSKAKIYAVRARTLRVQPTIVMNSTAGTSAKAVERTRR